MKRWKKREEGKNTDEYMEEEREEGKNTDEYRRRGGRRRVRWK